LAEDPRFILVASYFLPIRPIDRDDAGDPAWFRVYAYFDLAMGAERVVLTYGGDQGADPLVRIQRESLLERFPLADGGASKRLWHASVRQMVARGAGVAMFVSPEGFDAELQEMPGDAAPAARLLAHHLHGRPSRPIVFEGEAETDGIDVLERAGMKLCEPFRARAANGSGDHEFASARARMS
jgi:hypothetical protein